MVQNKLLCFQYRYSQQGLTFLILSSLLDCVKEFYYLQALRFVHEDISKYVLGENWFLLLIF